MAHHQSPELVNPVLLAFLATGRAVESDLGERAIYDSLLPPISPERLVKLGTAIEANVQLTGLDLGEVRSKRQGKLISRDALDTLAQAAIRHEDDETLENVRDHLRHGQGLVGRWMAFSLGIQRVIEPQSENQ